ncbi:ATP-grasp domain-containing protein [Mucilaginibacter sp. S1162]|uniref:ATP-grasp domain-containing protein n=1 Tax=Mucilaginibacter humi TaxID=2732510 RepID=A0ABX1W2Q4_9SPHI|nr:ATP-grasp domain-containing protein [Mucilaginibacter humi]NNU34139.1 ATP-grasp domain-containing protein [Mucilaginibacter humi]
MKDRLEYIHEQEGLNLIIPNYDAELYNFIKIAPRLKSMGIKTFLPTHEQLDARDKINLYEFGITHGFSVPADKKLNSITDLTNASEELGYPLVVKGKYYEAYVNHTADVAQKSFHPVSAKWGLPVIAQKFIKGTEINIAGLGDGKGNTISVIPMRKLFITDKGKAWAGITIENNDLIKLAQKFVKATKWKGGFELEIMCDADGEFFIMEINPRFPARIYLTAGAGQNQPAALVRMAMGEDVEPFTQYTVGKMFIRYSWDHIIDIADFQQFSAFGELSVAKVNL